MFELTCFVVSPIGPPGSDVRARADLVFEQLVSPAIASVGLRPLRADHIERPGLITLQMLDYLVRSPLVVADATGNNPNVLYEIGVRHALGTPLIQIAAVGSQLPFDIETVRRIEYDPAAPETFAATVDRIAAAAELLLASRADAGFSLHDELGLDYQSVDGLLVDAARELRDTHRRLAGDGSDARRIEHLRFLVDFVRRIDPDNGHGHYFAGELAMLRGDRDQMRREFFKYLERLARDGPALVHADTGQEICYRFAHGYCRQRTGWICHLLATTFAADLDAAASQPERELYARRVADYCDRALESYPPGFAQIEPTVAMRRRAAEALEDGPGANP